MKLDKALFDQVAAEAALSPRLRKNYELRDSEDEECQRMLNVLQLGFKTPIRRHKNSSEVVLCIYGSAIERFYDENGNETEVVEMRVGIDTLGMVVEIGRYLSLEATNKAGVVCEVKSGRFVPMANNDVVL